MVGKCKSKNDLSIARVLRSTERPFPFRPTQFGQTQAMAREQFDRAVGEGRHAFPACVRKLSRYAAGMQASLGSLSSCQEEKRGREAERETARRGQAAGEELSASPLMGMLGGSSRNVHTWICSQWKKPITKTDGVTMLFCGVCCRDSVSSNQSPRTV